MQGSRVFHSKDAVDQRFVDLYKLKRGKENFKIHGGKERTFNRENPAAGGARGQTLPSIGRAAGSPGQADLLREQRKEGARRQKIWDYRDMQQILTK